MSDLPWCLCRGLLHFNFFTKPKLHLNESMQLLFQKAFIPVNAASNELTRGLMKSSVKCCCSAGEVLPQPCCGEGRRHLCSG